MVTDEHTESPPRSHSTGTRGYFHSLGSVTLPFALLFAQTFQTQGGRGREREEGHRQIRDIRGGHLTSHLMAAFLSSAVDLVTLSVRVRHQLLPAVSTVQLAARVSHYPTHALTLASPPPPPSQHLPLLSFI